MNLSSIALPPGCFPIFSEFPASFVWTNFLTQRTTKWIQNGIFIRHHRQTVNTLKYSVCSFDTTLFYRLSKLSNLSFCDSDVLYNTSRFALFNILVFHLQSGLKNVKNLTKCKTGLDSWLKLNLFYASICVNTHSSRSW